MRRLPPRAGRRRAGRPTGSTASPGQASPPRALATFAGNRGLVAWASAAAVKLARPDGIQRQSLPVVGGTAVDDLAAAPTGELALLVSAPTPAQGAGPGPFVATAAPRRRLSAPVDIGATGTAPLVGAKLASTVKHRELLLGNGHRS